MSIILKDFLDRNMEAYTNLVLADSVDPDDFTSKLQSLEDKWEHICPGFFGLKQSENSCFRNL